MTIDAATIPTDQLMGRLAQLGVTDPADCQFQVLWDSLRCEVRLLLSPRLPKASPLTRCWRPCEAPSAARGS